jgi:hypothetical protein
MKGGVRADVGHAIPSTRRSTSSSVTARRVFSRETKKNFEEKTFD